MRSFIRAFFCFIILSSSAFAQLFSAGVKVGAPLSDAFSNGTFPTVNTNVTVQSFSDAKKYIFGPMVELHLPFGFSVEADGLYRPLPLTIVTPTGVAGSLSNSYSSWEVTALGKYRFLHTPLIKPYVEAGPSFRFLTGLPDGHLSTHGFLLGVGIEIKILKLRLGPELRYTRWGSDFNSALTFPARSDQNQGELLIGFSF